MPRVIHFEITATNPSRAVSFYKTVFGWDIQKTDMPMEYWLATTGKPTDPGINGAIMPREGALANIIFTIEVPSFDDALRRVEANGGKAITSKGTIPGVGTHCYCQDTEGNVFGLLEETAEYKQQTAPKAAKKAAKKTKKK